METVEQGVNSNKNRNTRFVKVKETRVCKSCGQPILKGSKCLTTNKHRVGRQWQCMNCTRNLMNSKADINYNCDNYKNIKQTEAKLKCVAFGDDGAYLALQDCLEEQVARCFECGRCSLLKMI